VAAVGEIILPGCDEEVDAEVTELVWLEEVALVLVLGDTYIVELPLTRLASMSWQSASPWSGFAYHSLRSDGLQDSTYIEWKTGPGLLATGLVGLALLGNDSHGAADRVAAGVGMAYFQETRTQLSPQSVCEAAEEVAVWAAIARAGAPDTFLG
jgi:hypothetical protein